MGGLEIVGRWVGVVTSGGWVGLVRWGLGGCGQIGGACGMVCKWPCDISLERV